MKVKAATLILQDQLPSLGTGHRPVLFWEGLKYAYVFWMPALKVYQVHPKLWATIGKKDRPDADVKARALAIEANRAGARTRGDWDGGNRVTRMLELIAGQEVGEDAFEGEEEMAEPKEAPFKEKEPVTLTYDADFKGVIVRSGPEVSTIKPVGESKEMHIPNGNIVRIEAEAEPKQEKNEVKKVTTKKAAVAEKKKAAAGKFDKVRIVMIVGKNPRNAGSKAFKRFAKMEASVKKHPTWTAAEHLEACTSEPAYRTIDLNADVDRKSVKLVAIT